MLQHYLYHWVPKDMEGDVLYPLNVLKEKYPKIYTTQVSKYEGREKLLERVIPTLDCLWNDALHFSAVPPHIVKEALIEAGADKNIEMSCYKIDPHILDPQKTTVFLYPSTGIREMTKEDFTVFDPDDLEKYSSLPQETKDYYREMYKNNRRPLVFHKVVHILYKGSINVKDVPIVTV